MDECDTDARWSAIEPEASAQPRRLLQVAASLAELAFTMRSNPQMPQSVGQCQRVVCFGGEVAGSLERKNGSGIIVPDDLVEGADPELCFGLTPDITQALVQLEGAVEEGELVGDVGRSRLTLRRRIEEPSVDDPTTRQSQLGFDCAQESLGLNECASVAPKDGALVQPVRLLKTIVHSHTPQLDDRLR